MRNKFDIFASKIASAVGHPAALAVAFLMVIAWAISGPVLNFSNEWLLLINTITTIVTYLLVFVIQSSQNRESKAIHLKLDEIIRVTQGAKNDLIGTASATSSELDQKEKELLEAVEEATEAIEEEHDEHH